MAVIVLNKMFKGGYLENNLGHEVINLFKTDNGKCYLYLNDDGKFSAHYAGKITEMLLVKNGPVSNTLEVIGKSVGLKDFYQPPTTDTILNQKELDCEELLRQMKEIFQEDITYGGTYLHTIFAGNEYQYVNITFEATTVKLVKEGVRIIISFTDNFVGNANDTVIYLTQKEVMRRSLKEYFEEEKQPKDYNELNKIINTPNLWDKEIEPVNPETLMIDSFYQRILHNRYLNKLFK